MEYGGAQFQGAAASHLAKLDAIQESAMKLGNFEIESLQSRREASTTSLVFKLLDGKGRGELNQFTPSLKVYREASRYPARSCSNPYAQPKSGIRLEDPTDAYSLDQYKRSIAGTAPRIWDSLPQELLEHGLDGGWGRINKQAKNVLTGKTDRDALYLPRNTTPASSPVRMPVLPPPGAPVKPKVGFSRLKSTPNLWDQLSHFNLFKRPKNSKKQRINR
jgi:hypothetical protein